MIDAYVYARFWGDIGSWSPVYLNYVHKYRSGSCTARVYDPDDRYDTRFYLDGRWQTVTSFQTRQMAQRIRCIARKGGYPSAIVRVANTRDTDSLMRTMIRYGVAL